MLPIVAKALSPMGLKGKVFGWLEMAMLERQPIIFKEKQYGADGKLRDIITDLQSNATGKLAFLGNVVVIDKNEIDKAGNAITKYWELK
jgi:hypothetical protein